MPVAIDDHGCIKATQRQQAEGAPKTGDLAVKVGAVAVRALGVAGRRHREGAEGSPRPARSQW